MIICPDIGTLRSSLDDSESPESRSALTHVESCARCRSELAELESNAVFVSRSLRLLAEPTNVPAAMPRLTPLEPIKDPISSSLLPISVRAGWIARWRLALGSAAAVALVAFAALTPQGQTATAAFLAQFRGQRLAVVSLDPDQTRIQLPELGNYGSFQGSTRQRPEQVASLAEASQRVGFQVLTPNAASLPPTLKSDPRVSVMSANEIRVTFDANKAAEYFKSLNRNDLRMPDKINGTTLVIKTPSAALLEYPSSSQNEPGLIVAQAGELQAGTEGAASLEEVRDYLLSMPTLTEATARQLRAISDWRSTLPIPVPVDQVQWSPTTVNGAPGYMFGNKNGLGGALLWTTSGKTYGVGGLASENDLQRVASSLH